MVEKRRVVCFVEFFEKMTRDKIHFYNFLIDVNT